MTAPQVDLDQLRRQFPEEVTRYFDAMIAAKFAAIDSQIADIQEQLNWIQQIIDDAVEQAEQDFIHTALQDLVTELQPYISQAVATDLQNWVYNSKPGSTARYKFYIDSQENIESLPERQKWVIYIGTEEEPDESSEFEEVTPGTNPSTDV